MISYLKLRRILIIISISLSLFFLNWLIYLIRHGKDLKTLREYVQRMNEKQSIENEDKFGPLRPDDHIFVIQVHQRAIYLKLLIESLKNVKGIGETLLIFSHDFIDVEINDLISSVKFAKILQIFYPYSTQLYPNTFPGDDPNDCPRNIAKEEAIKVKCNNAEYPDSFGHYRESRFAQMKHHWFWKMNYVFDYLRVTRSHTGYVTFIEEDDYLFPDSVYILNYLRSNRLILGVDIASLGNLDSSNDFLNENNLIEIQDDIPKHTITITKQFWMKLKRCAKQFCEYDEYNYDWSFYYICSQCVQPRPLNLIVTASRIQHTGDCGVHQNKQDCYKSYNKTLKLLHYSMDYLFPGKFKIISGNKKVALFGPFGGFNDPRDHRLCLSFLRES